jgi:hypothetical protein
LNRLAQACSFQLGHHIGAGLGAFELDHRVVVAGAQVRLIAFGFGLDGRLCAKADTDKTVTMAPKRIWVAFMSLLLEW